jgi:CBS domain-containing membrane protein
LKISDCMKRNVISASPNTSIRDAVQILVKNHIGTLPVVDHASRLIGLVRVRDLITLAMPDFVHLLENVDFVHDFGAVENQKPGSDILVLPIEKIMGEPVAVEETAGLLRAAALLQEHKLNDLPVVNDENRLVGIASYVDIGVALMSGWK